MAGLRITAVVASLILLPTYTAAEERPRQQEQRFFAETGVMVETGDFGTAVDTTIVSVPFTVGYRTERFEVSASIPYLRISTTGFTTLSLGGPVALSETAAALQPSAQVPNPTRTQPSPVIGQEVSRETTSGLGDLTVQASYLLLPEAEPWPALAPWVSMKLPTADKDKGLGTGKLDVGFGAVLTRTFGRSFASADLGYIIIGEPDGVDLNNVFVALLTLGHSPVEPLTIYGLFEYRTAVVDRVADPMSLGFGAHYALSEAFGLKAEGWFGLAASAPDAAGTVSVEYRF